MLLWLELVTTHPAGIGESEHTWRATCVVTFVMLYRTPVTHMLLWLELVTTHPAGIGESEHAWRATCVVTFVMLYRTPVTHMLLWLELVTTHPAGIGESEHTWRATSVVTLVMLYRTPVTHSLLRYELVTTHPSGIGELEQICAVVDHTGVTWAAASPVALLRGASPTLGECFAVAETGAVAARTAAGAAAAVAEAAAGPATNAARARKVAAAVGSHRVNFTRSPFREGRKEWTAGPAVVTTLAPRRRTGVSQRYQLRPANVLLRP
ncbi:hypothetical protein ACM614_14980 [Streptomyces sp. 12297]